MVHIYFYCATSVLWRFVIFCCLISTSFSVRAVDFLQESSGFSGGVALNIGSLQINGNTNKDFDGSTPFFLGFSYIAPFNKSLYEAQILYYEYGFSYTSFAGEEVSNETCVLDGTRQNCSVTNDARIISLHGSILAFYHFSEYASLFGRLGLGFYQMTISQVATGDDGNNDNSNDSSNSFAPLIGLGALLAKNIKLEVLQYFSFGGNVDSARNPVAQVEGKYSATELRLSAIF